MRTIMAPRALSAKRSRMARDEAARRLDRMGDIHPGMSCQAFLDPGQECDNVAGYKTTHHGVGRCAYHGGTSTFETVIAAIMSGHGLARELDIAPWEALLGEVRRSAGTVAWLDLKVGSATDDDDLVGGGSLAPWVAMWQDERRNLTRVSKLAMDASIDQHMVAQMQTEAKIIANVLIATLTRLGLNDDQMDMARSILRSELMALDTGVRGITMNDQGMLEGKIVVGDGDDE